MKFVQPFDAENLEDFEFQFSIVFSSSPKYFALEIKIVNVSLKTCKLENFRKVCKLA